MVRLKLAGWHLELSTDVEEQQSQTETPFEGLAFGKHIIIYAAGNGLIILFGFVQVFIIAKYLSIEDYGYWQTFLLYAGYYGILHLGFIDGILLRWAGKTIEKVGSEIRIALSFLMIQQIIIIIPLCTFILVFTHPPFQSLALLVLGYALVSNVADFFMFTVQAVKRFGLLTLALISKSLVLLLFVIVLLIIDHMSYSYVIIALLTSYLLFIIFYAFQFRHYLSTGKSPVSQLWAYGEKTIKIGVFVTLSGLVFILASSIDRFIVSTYFTIEQFAIYTFAFTATLVAYTFIDAISRVFLPYIALIAHEVRTQLYYWAKSAIMVAWAIIIVIYFPGAKLVELYLPAYINSLPIIRILLCAIGFYSLIQIVQANYFKTFGKQFLLFLVGAIVLTFLVVSEIVALKVWGGLESVAAAYCVGMIVWYVAGEFSLQTTLHQNANKLWKGILIPICFISIFWLADFVSDRYIIQMGVYLGFFLVITFLFLRQEIRDLVIIAGKYGEMLIRKG